MILLSVCQKSGESGKAKLLLCQQFFALAADFHDGDFSDVEEIFRACDAVLIVGDLVDRHSGGYQNAIRFVERVPELAPTFYAIGNHERRLKTLADYWPHVERSRVVVLDDRFVNFEGVTLGALTSRERRRAQTAFLEDMQQQDGFRLCGYR